MTACARISSLRFVWLASPQRGQAFLSDKLHASRASYVDIHIPSTTTCSHLLPRLPKPKSPRLHFLAHGRPLRVGIRNLTARTIQTVRVQALLVYRETSSEAPAKSVESKPTHPTHPHRSETHILSLPNSESTAHPLDHIPPRHPSPTTKPPTKKPSTPSPNRNQPQSYKTPPTPFPDPSASPPDKCPLQPASAPPSPV